MIFGFTEGGFYQEPLSFDEFTMHLKGKGFTKTSWKKTCPQS